MIRAALLLLLAGLAVGCARAPRAAAPPPADPLRNASGEALYRRGLALADVGDLVRAEQYLSSAIERGYPEAVALPALIRVCVASSRLRAALGYAEPYLERRPGAWSLRYLVASIHLALGEVERARAALERVVADAPDQPDAYYALAVVLRDQVGDREAAARRFAEYVARAPAGDHADAASAALRALAAPAPAPPEVAR